MFIHGSTVVEEVEHKYCYESDYLAGACDCSEGGGAVVISDETPEAPAIRIGLKIQARRTETAVLETAGGPPARSVSPLFTIDSTLTITISIPTETTSTTMSSSQSSPTRTDHGLTGIQTVVPTVVPITPGSSNSNNNSGASLGIKLGLGLGIPFLVVLIIAFVFCVHRRQRRRQRKERQYPPYDFEAPERKPVSVADFPARRPGPPPPRPPRSDELDVEGAAGGRITGAGMGGAKGGAVNRSARRGKVPEKNSSHTSQLPQARWSWRRRERGKDKEKEKAKAKAKATERRASAWGKYKGRGKDKGKRGEDVHDAQVHQAVAYEAPSGPPAVPVSMLAPAPGAINRKGIRRPPRAQQEEDEGGSPVASSGDWPLPRVHHTTTTTKTTKNSSKTTGTERDKDERRASRYFSPQHLYRQWESRHSQPLEPQDQHQHQPQHQHSHQQQEQAPVQPRVDNQRGRAERGPGEQRHQQANLTVDTTRQRPVGVDEISPLSSAGSAPFRRGRMSAVSGLGWENTQ